MRYNEAMISKLSGILAYADPRSIILDVNGVGYKLFTTIGTLENFGNLDGQDDLGKQDKKNGKQSSRGAKIGQMLTFWTYLAVRENAMDLYGFVTKDELDIFEELIGVSGIGPKTALGILSVANPATIQRAVATEDPSYLTSVSGVGKKNAEKIVLELKGKLVAVIDEKGSAARAYGSDSLEALKSLGYQEREAREALKKVPAEITDTAECVKQALKILSK
jgi:Holliday junction DNA helicase RuvA